jgi:uncharacterized membrane protein
MVTMRLFGNILLYFLALGVAAYAAVVYGFFPLGALLFPEMKANFELHSAGIYIHVFASVLALALGPFQFSRRLRQKYTAAHRWSGRVYLLSVAVGGISGLYMAQFAFGGLVPRLGFSALAVCWLFSASRAYRAIRRGDIANHRRWMLRNFSLTFAAVTLRLYLPLALVAGADPEYSYAAIAWLCWLPNLVAAEWLIYTGRRPLVIVADRLS